MVLAQWTMASTSTRCKGSIRIPMPKDAKPGRPIKLDYCYGIATVFDLDICRMMNCGMYADPFYKAEKYLCIATDINGYPRDSSACQFWEQASWLTHPGYEEGYYPKEAPWTEVQKEISMCKEKYSKNLILTLKAGLVVPNLGRLAYKKEDDRGFYLLLRIDIGGEDPMVMVYLQARRCAAGQLTPGGSNGAPKIASISTPQVISQATKDLEIQGDTWEVETGGLYENMWIKWINYTAQAQGKTNCIICASGRPRLTIAPARITPFNSATGFACLLGLFVEGHIRGCTNKVKALLDVMYPQVSTRVIPPSFDVNLTPHYHCIQGNGKGRIVGSLPPGTCNTTREIALLSNMTRARSDIWWFCGGRVLRGVLPVNFSGICAIVQLVMPVFILPNSVDVMDLKIWKNSDFPEIIRQKRANMPVPGSFDNNIYLDAIGVPRGVPNEHKARNQVAAGFESVFFWWATINKNVDWINYIYYNQQRFVNFTTDAIKGLKEQLDATSRMTYQNRIALDMILANQGGVCAMFGTSCCTFIPNNTAPEGSVSRALAGLQALRLELAENSGITDPFTGWMEGMFGKWRGAIQSVLLMGIVAATVLIVVGCCCIPCIRGLLNRLITTAVGVPGESGVLQAYVGIEYAPLPRDDEIIERPDLIMLRNRE